MENTNGNTTSDKTALNHTFDAIVYAPRQRPPWWYEYAALIGVSLSTLAVVLLCVFLISDPNKMSSAFGAVALVLYIPYAGRFYYFFFQSLKFVTKRAVLTPDKVEVSCAAYTKELNLSDVVFSMSYSSSTNLCIILATADDYITLLCSCGYLMASGGKEVLRPFYAINKKLMAMNENHVNYIRNKRYKKKNPFKIPSQVFEVEFHTARSDKLVDQLRIKYPFK